MNIPEMRMPEIRLPEMRLPEIRTLVPQAGAMVLLDRLLRADDETLCAEVTIGAASLFCDGRAVGAWVGIEFMAQAIAAHAGYAAHLRGEPVKAGFLLGARRYRALRPAFCIGSVLQVHVRRALQGENGLRTFECRIDDMGDAAGEAVNEAPGAAVTVASATVMVFEPDNMNDFLQGSAP